MASRNGADVRARGIIPPIHGLAPAGDRPRARRRSR
jgi:hypothetical protein